jgi:hypothetical protein
MSRPICPHCKQPVIVTTSRADGQVRVQYFGCRTCGAYSGHQPRVIIMSQDLIQKKESGHSCSR